MLPRRSIRWQMERREGGKEGGGGGCQTLEYTCAHQKDLMGRAYTHALSHAAATLFIAQADKQTPQGQQETSRLGEVLTTNVSGSSQTMLRCGIAQSLTVLHCARPRTPRNPTGRDCIACLLNRKKQLRRQHRTTKLAAQNCAKTPF